MILIAPTRGEKDLENYIDWITSCGLECKILTSDVKEINYPLLLCGGADVGKNPVRDELEFGWIKSALNNNQPIIGVCRGMQILNIYFGGLVDTVSESITEDHRLDEFEDDSDHSERLSQFHLVEDKFGNGLRVNSRHHQYCSKVADNFQVTYTSVGCGNIPEAFEDKNRKIYAVQWHPERGESSDDLFPLSLLF